MKTYRTEVALGLILAVLLGAAALAGYGVVLYYNWLNLFLVLLVLALPTLKRQPSAIAYLCAVLILVGSSVAGAFGGHCGRRLQSRINCQACEPLLTLVQSHRDEHGQFPMALSDVEGFALAQRQSNLDVVQGEFSSHGISLRGINSHDALIYPDTNFVSCVVPVTTNQRIHQSGCARR